MDRLQRDVVPIQCSSTCSHVTRTIPRLTHAPTLKSLIALWVAIVLALTTFAPSHAQSRRLSLVRDAEIEALLGDYLRPLMKAAGLKRGSVQLYLVNDSSFNAYVAGRGLYVNTGLLLQSEKPNQVIGVLAHELGHIIGGHQFRLSERLDRARRIATITTLLGVGLGVAGSATGNRDVANAGFGVGLGGSSLAMRDLLSYRRGEEVAADAAAVNLLRKTKQSGQGMLTTFKRLGDQLAIQGRRASPYLSSHPAPGDRVRNLESRVRASPFFRKPDPKSRRKRHDMVRAKIAAYSGNDRYARAVLLGKELHPDAKRYGLAIGTFLRGEPRRALPTIDKLLKRDSKNAYLHEMRGEILLRMGKGKQAAKSFRRAVKLDKTKAGFIRIELAHALLESGGKKNAKEAIQQINKGLARDRTALAGYQLLARAYAETGDPARALLASAELSYRTGRKAQAKSYARRAQKAFKRGSPAWLRAQDLITAR